MSKLEETFFNLKEYLKICNPSKRWFVERQIKSVEIWLSQFKNKTAPEEKKDETYEMARNIFGLTENAVPSTQTS